MFHEAKYQREKQITWDTWILEEFCAVAIRISSPKTDLGNHHLADNPQRKQWGADSVFEADDLNIKRQNPPAVPNPDPTWRKEGWEEVRWDFLRTGQGMEDEGPMKEMENTE